MKVYFISGLAADKTVFRHMELPPGFQPVYLDWIAPAKKETLSSYATRMAENIDTSQPFGLVGLSMGGMMVIEISKQFRPEFLVLISSIPVSSHLPFYYRWLATCRMHLWIPIPVFQMGSILKRLFTTESKEDKILLKRMIRRSDPAFIRWAMGAILCWENKQFPGNYIHIHGTSDELLPYRFTSPTHTIKKGGHLMILNRAKEINQILREELPALTS